MINGQELAKLYDHIVNVDEADKKNDNTANEPTNSTVNEVKVLKNPQKTSKKVKEKIKSESGIEEIRLVRVAVKAFKRKKRLRDIPKGQRKSKKTKFESVVEKVVLKIKGPIIYFIEVRSLSRHKWWFCI